MPRGNMRGRRTHCCRARHRRGDRAASDVAVASRRQRMSAAAIAERIAGQKVKKTKGGNYLVCCPAHGDDNPSLSLRDGDRGLLLYCFTGCAPADVFAAIRRIDRGLLEPGDTQSEPAKGSLEYER